MFNFAELKCKYYFKTVVTYIIRAESSLFRIHKLPHRFTREIINYSGDLNTYIGEHNYINRRVKCVYS